MTEPDRDIAGPSVALVHAFDPRGQKLGGLETYVRDFIRFCPPDIRLLVIGVDGRGDLAIGRVATIELFGRRVGFMPILAWPEEGMNGAARRLSRSLTLRFACALLAHGPSLRRRLRRSRASVDNRRVELGPICRLLGVPVVQMMHDDGLSVPRDALIQHFLWIYRLAERLSLRTAARFFCVNPLMTARLRHRFPVWVHKIDTVTTWYDPTMLRPTPFRMGDDVLRVVYAGRLDTVKNPALMADAIAALLALRGGRGVEFHYIGGGDLDRWTAFAGIRAVTVCHGFRTMAEQAEILAGMHMAILTSHMEGMPRCVLESLGAGRPVAAVHLPQLEPVIRSGSGGLVARDPDEAAMADGLARLMLALWEDIRAGRLTPEGVAAAVADHTPERQLGRVFAEHRALRREAMRQPSSVAWGAEVAR